MSMNRRLQGREKSLNDPIKGDNSTEWQDWLVATNPDQELKMSQDIPIHPIIIEVTSELKSEAIHLKDSLKNNMDWKQEMLMVII